MGWSTYAETEERWIAGELEVEHPGGGAFADIRRRVCPILEDLAARHRGQTIVVMANGVVIRVALHEHLVVGSSPADFDRIAIDFASVNDLWYDGRTWTAHTLNQVVAPSPSPASGVRIAGSAEPRRTCGRITEPVRTGGSMNHEIGSDGPGGRTDSNHENTKHTKTDRRIGPDGLTGGPGRSLSVYFVHFVVESGGRTVPFHAFGGE